MLSKNIYQDQKRFTFYRIKYKNQMQRSSITQEQKYLPYYKIIVLGMSSAGKTKLLTRYIYKSYVDSGQSTMMVDCSFVNRTNAKYAYYDTAGQEIYRSILNLYFKGSDAAILIYSVDSPRSFQQIAFYHQKIQEQAPDCQLFIIGCKSDLETAVTPEIVAKEYPGIRHFVTSAKNNEGIGQAFEAIESSLLKMDSKISKISRINLRDSVKPRPKQKRCCG